jgi:hypothetical protein
VATLLIDTPPAPEPDAKEQGGALAPDGSTPGGSSDAPQGRQAAPGTGQPATACASCLAPLASGQDWCLECGAGAPTGTLGSGWRPATMIIAATVALVLGATAAGYAALSKQAPARRVVTQTVAQTPPASVPATTVPATSTPAGALPGTTAVKPPKIPLTAKTPRTAVGPGTVASTGTGTGTGSGTGSGTGTGTGGKAKSSNPEKTGGAAPLPKPILLDTNAAQTYNPYGYPSATFGDPSLTIDGDTSTGWTAQINPETAPLLAEGVLIDLNTAQKLASLELVSSSAGMTVQVYGANGQTVPASITDPAWVPLSHALLVKKQHMKIKLLHPKKSFRFVTLWISKAGAESVGTATAPGHVSVEELELFPPAS